jgi:hypothetical protein
MKQGTGIDLLQFLRAEVKKPQEGSTPISPDLDVSSCTVAFRSGNGENLRYWKPSQLLRGRKLFAKDLRLRLPLGRDGEMLPLASSTVRKMSTERDNSLGRRGQDLFRLRFEIVTPDLPYLCAKDISLSRVGNENDEAPPPSQPHPPENQLLYRQVQAVAYLG